MGLPLWSNSYILLVEFQPFKQSVNHLTQITIMFASFLALSQVAALGASSSMEISGLVPFFIGVMFITLSLPLLYISSLILCWIYSNATFGRNIVRRLQAKRRGYSLAALHEGGGLTYPLSHLHAWSSYIEDLSVSTRALRHVCSVGRKWPGADPGSPPPFLKKILLPPPPKTFFFINS